ncbi:nucleotidyltransferase domain-containing protein [Deinococcus sp. HMF7604]|uniref:PD-(D/E)XK nuclease domain-containing protein n=1 Tax=Deinococcus betulae TaxID=2873312 RepID=UPI001CCDBB4B|nr:nucleotidyltransferase domain-containing protein [Deinococcus betulae]MBZ9752995.1 nucleotidyltransferase domain-containing protein [Deinococcus betulae]
MNHQEIGMHYRTDVDFETFSLKDLVLKLTSEFLSITELYIFGSRRYRTMSRRSDVDILLRSSAHIQPARIRSFTLLNCPALDIFISEGGKAISCANESYVMDSSFDLLVNRLDAICIFRDGSILSSADVDWTFEIPIGVDIPMTSMIGPEPSYNRWRPALRGLLSQVQTMGLPTEPYIASDYESFASFTIDILKRSFSVIKELNTKGKSSQIAVSNEYDLQNLFWILNKPWLPTIAREEVTLIYDGSSKVADFNIANNAIVYEFKHIKNTGTKASVLKTIKGLEDFYTRNPNIQVLVFVVLIEHDVEMDDRRIESEFSKSGDRTVQVYCIRNNPRR